MDDFVQTMTALERGLLVRNIMSAPLITIAPGDDPRAFFRAHEASLFDCVPVREGGRVVGMVDKDRLEHPDVPGACTAAEVLRPLAEVPLVSEHESISNLIAAMRATGRHHWLVISGVEIAAIVTRSDLWKMPVQLLAWTRIMHLEKQMALAIGARHATDEWMAALSPGRREAVHKVMENLRRNNEHIDPLECTTFSQKVDIANRLFPHLCAKADLGGVVTLRDQLAHGRAGDGHAEGINTFLHRLQVIDRFVEAFEKVATGAAVNGTVTPA